MALDFSGVVSSDGEARELHDALRGLLTSPVGLSGTLARVLFRLGEILGEGSLPRAPGAETPSTDPGRVAVGLYALMARDVGDALEAIEECTDRPALEALLAMLTAQGRPKTDQGLNALFVDPVKSRLGSL